MVNWDLWYGLNIIFSSGIGQGGNSQPRQIGPILTARIANQNSELLYSFLSRHQPYNKDALVPNQMRQTKLTVQISISEFSYVTDFAGCKRLSRKFTVSPFSIHQCKLEEKIKKRIETCAKPREVWMEQKKKMNYFITSHQSFSLLPCSIR